MEEQRIREIVREELAKQRTSSKEILSIIANSGKLDRSSALTIDDIQK